MVARLTAGWALLGDGRLAQAEEEIERGLALSRSLGASRFEPILMESQARISWLQGRRSQAREQITRAADAVGRQQLQRFIGPWVYGTLALLSNDAVLRRQALTQGNASLSKDCVAHNAFRFLVAAAEAALLDGEVLTDLRAQGLCNYKKNRGVETPRLFFSVQRIIQPCCSLPRLSERRTRIVW
jgi:hypothetical protein